MFDKLKQILEMTRDPSLPQDQIGSLHKQYSDEYDRIKDGLASGELKSKKGINEGQLLDKLSEFDKQARGQIKNVGRVADQKDLAQIIAEKGGTAYSAPSTQMKVGQFGVTQNKTVDPLDAEPSKIQAKGLDRYGKPLQQASMPNDLVKDLEDSSQKKIPSAAFNDAPTGKFGKLKGILKNVGALQLGGALAGDAMGGDTNSMKGHLFDAATSKAINMLPGGNVIGMLAPSAIADEGSITPESVHQKFYETNPSPDAQQLTSDVQNAIDNINPSPEQLKKRKFNKLRGMLNPDGAVTAKGEEQ